MTMIYIKQQPTNTLLSKDLHERVHQIGLVERFKKSFLIRPTWLGRTFALYVFERLYSAWSFNLGCSYLCARLAPTTYCRIIASVHVTFAGRLLA